MAWAPASAHRGDRGEIGPGVLLVEDDPGYTMLVKSMIQETALAELGFEHAARLSDASERVREGPPGCVLLDLGLPDARHLEAVEGLRATDPELPIVVLTGTEDGALAADAVAAGAQDYLVKGEVDSFQLAHAVRYAIERKRRESAHSEELLHDPLTGLPARLLFADRLEVAISRSQSAGRWVTLVVVEVEEAAEADGEPRHDARDVVLREIARRLANLRPHDSIARDGGRFYVLFEELESAPDGMALAGRLGADLREARLEAAETPLSPWLTVGVAVGGGGVTPGDLIENAEAAMGRLTMAWPPEPPRRTPVVRTTWNTQLETLRGHIDSAIDSGLGLDEIEVLLNREATGEEVRDAAWLYAWSVLQQRAEGHGPRTRS
jgi:diguanylate cyclase (GGDEF)-like protein